MGDEVAEKRACHLLLATDALLFGNSRGPAKAPRRAQVAERLQLFDRGDWGTMWTLATSRGEKRGGPQLIEAKELPRAAAAVWGGGLR